MNNLVLRRSHVDYFIVFLVVVMTSGVSMFGANIFRLLLLMSALVVLYLRNKGYSLKDFKLLLIFYFIWTISLLFSFEIALFSSGQVWTYLSFFTLALGSYYAIKAADNFLSTYVRVIYHLSIISFVFFTIQQFNYDLIQTIVSSFDSINEFFKGETRSSMIIYSHPIGTNFSARNSGFATEPGEFAVFLVLALFVQLILNNHRIDKYIVVLSVALLTTFSTAGYIGFLFLGIYYLYEREKISHKLVYGLLIIPLIGMLLNQEFVIDKIENRYQEEIYNYESAYSRTITPGRFGSLILDFQDFSKKPLVGYGIHNKTRFINYDGIEQQRTNGLSEYLVTFGVFGFLIMIFNHYKSFQKFGDKRVGKLGVLLIISGIYVTAFSQVILSTPLFFILQYYHFLEKNN